MSPAHHPTVPSIPSPLVTTEGRVLPLRAATLRVDARAGLARVTLEQRFENPHAETLAVTYRLPLPADGALSGYAFHVGGRRVAGEVDRRATARERFEQAVVAGRRAALLEQERSSLFTQEIHGIPPGAELRAEISVDQRLAWLPEGGWEWRFPTAAAPRYLGGAVADPERVAIDVAEAKLPVRFALALQIRDAIAEGRRPESPSHAVASFRMGGAVNVTLGAGEAPLDRDVVVRWPAARPSAGVTVDLARPPAALGDQPDGAYALVCLVPPAPAHRPLPLPRDLVILLDRSGSMDGEPLAQAKRVIMALVEGLGGADTLELLAFGADVERFGEGPARATPQARRDALAWIASRRAGGGTEMRAAIVAALAPGRARAQRQVVVVSDGLIGFEEETVADVLAHLSEGSRLHTLGVGAAVNRSFTAAAARAGRGVEVIVGLGEDPERAAQRLVARTEAPLVVDVTLGGSALVDHAPARLPDLFAAAPALVSARVSPGGGDLVVRGRTADGAWEQRVKVPATSPGEGAPGVIALFGREAVEDAEMRRCAGEDARALDAVVERLGLDFQIATRLTSWVAVDEEAPADPDGPVRTVRVPQELPQGLSAEALGLRAPAPPAPRGGSGGGGPPPPRPAGGGPPPPRSGGPPYDALRVAPSGGDVEEKTRVTQVIQPPPAAIGVRAATDCLVVIYTKEPTLLGKRFVLEQTVTRIGRGADGHVVLEGDSVSRRHAHLEQRRSDWVVVDDGSTNGTYVNDERISREAALRNGDRIKIGPTIFKFLTGADVEAQYHEEIYRMTILDGLTGVHNKRYLYEALEREIVRGRRHERDLSLLLFDIDHFKRINDVHGHLAGDFVLRELSRVVSSRIRRDEVLARYGGEEFAVVLPETSLGGAVALADAIRQKVAEHTFVFEGDAIRVTISVGAAVLAEGDRAANDLVKRADERLYEAKRGGRDRVCS